PHGAIRANASVLSPQGRAPRDPATHPARPRPPNRLAPRRPQVPHRKRLRELPLTGEARRTRRKRCAEDPPIRFYLCVRCASAVTFLLGALKWGGIAHVFAICGPRQRGSITASST